MCVDIMGNKRLWWWLDFSLSKLYELHLKYKRGGNDFHTFPSKVRLCCSTQLNHPVWARVIRMTRWAGDFREIWIHVWQLSTHVSCRSLQLLQLCLKKEAKSHHICVREQNCEFVCATWKVPILCVDWFTCMQPYESYQLGLTAGVNCLKIKSLIMWQNYLSI